MDLELRFGPRGVGTIEGVFWSDNTGYGRFRLSDVSTDDPVMRRVREYVAFSEEWHERLTAGAEYSRAEWDAFRDVYDSGMWYTVGTDGTVSRIGGPLFVSGEVTWGPVPVAGSA
jgi:hypothetical protein